MECLAFYNSRGLAYAIRVELTLCWNCCTCATWNGANFAGDRPWHS